MSDYTMCTGGDCPYRYECKRYTMKDNGQYQSWFLELPLMELDGEVACAYYWPDH